MIREFQIERKMWYHVSERLYS